MSRKIKKLYKPLIWFFCTVIAAGTLAGCGDDATTKYGPPPAGRHVPSTYQGTK